MTLQRHDHACRGKRGEQADWAHIDWTRHIDSWFQVISATVVNGHREIRLGGLGIWLFREFCGR